MNSSRHNFSMIPRANIPRSVFDRGHTRKMTMDADYLTPIFIDEVLPGDSFKLDCNLFARLASPLTTPVMDNMYFDVFWFYVPTRLLWDNFAKMMGEQENPGDSTDYLVPEVKFDATHPVEVGSLADYMGIPLFLGEQDADAPSQSGDLKVVSLPFRAYNLIWNEWFRDQNLQDSVPVLKGDADWNNGDETEGFEDGYKLLKRAKRHDYFTSALPWPQKGPGVEIPIGNVAPVALYNTTGTEASVDGFGDKAFDFVHGTYGANNLLYTRGSNEGESASEVSQYPVNNTWGSSTILGADLGSATAITINSLRQAFQLQRWYEVQARSGSRMTEIIRSFFGVVSPDARLQRPEYLGGSSQPFIINPISQTSATTSVTPQGNLVAVGMTGSRKRGFRKSFVEHGYIIGLAHVRSDVNYQQGLRKMWSRRSRFDYYWPQLAHLGEQAILNKELFVQGSGVVDDNGEALDDKVFGYQERWSEYRYFPNEIVGKMRSTAATSLDIWHLAQYFTEMPKLNSEFIESASQIARVSAVPSEPTVLLDIEFSCKVARPMPVYSVPGLIDHF